jgi:anti-sigma regulatory factor (Ser/Thr protein kinase)
MAADISRWERGFEPDDRSARTARSAVREVLVGADIDEEVVARALLVLTELVGNAVRHARTDFTISVAAAAGTLRIEVADLDTRPPTLMRVDPESTSGRGLRIVAGIAADWGWQNAERNDGGSGKVVWAELDLGDGQ